MKNLLLFSSVTFLMLLFIQGNSMVGTLDSAYAQQEWKQEFADVCAETQNAMTLSVSELKSHIERCDKLFERLDELNGMEGGSAKKVYAKRLKMCRDLYEFTLEHKEK